jgi:uncharacterized protein YdeI (YjbR/CyaY-like superfamily)
MVSPKTIDARTFRSQAAFRAWLEVNHDRVAELFVRCFRVEHAARGLTYRQALDEALCFGWIDGVRHRLDDVSFASRFTPRKPDSVWSRVNSQRVSELEAAGRISSAGRAAFARGKGSSYSFESPARLGPGFRKRLRANAEAWLFFSRQAPWYRRTSSHWVMSAKREETREKRFGILLDCSAAGQPVPPLRRVGVRARPDR